MNISKFKRLGVKISEKLIFMVFKSDDMEWYWLLDFSTGLIIVYLLCLTMTLCTIQYSNDGEGQGGSMSQVVELPNNSYKPIINTAQVLVRLCILQKGCSRLTATSDKVYQLLAHGRWFSPGTPASSTTKTGRHDIAEILLKVALKHQKSNQNQIK